MTAATLHHRKIAVGAVHLHCVEAGEGPLVVLLHGFPEFWYSWRRQLPALAEAGFHAVAPDLRGYHQSDKPRGVAAYRTAELVADVEGLIVHMGDGPAAVVGHDWGGVVAWRLAALRPELVDRLAVLNAPHPERYRIELVRNPLQWLRSAYAMLFQAPWLPEKLLAARDFALVERSLRTQPAVPTAFTDDDIAQYKQALGQPGGLTEPLNYYRAALRYPRDLYGEPQGVAAETLVIWGEQDPFLGLRLTEGLERWAPRVRVERIAESSHWVQNEAPERVNRLLIEFLRRS